MGNLILFSSFIPGIIICAVAYLFIYRSRKVPLIPLFICFFLGLLISFFAFYLEKYLMENHGGSIIKEAFLWVAFTEEFLKFVVLVSFTVYFAKYVKLPTDFVIYSLCVALGFATIENVLYGYMFGFNTSIVRAFTAIPAHATFGIIMGSGISLWVFKMTKLRVWLVLFLTLISVTFLHGIYDFFILQNISENLLVGSLICLLLYIIFSVWIIRKFRTKNNELIFKAEKV